MQQQSTPVGKYNTLLVVTTQCVQKKNVKTGQNRQGPVILDKMMNISRDYVFTNNPRKLPARIDETKRFNLSSLGNSRKAQSQIPTNQKDSRITSQYFFASVYPEPGRTTTAVALLAVHGGRLGGLVGFGPVSLGVLCAGKLFSESPFFLCVVFMYSCTAAVGMNTMSPSRGPTPQRVGWTVTG